jgi:hypothetical protein
MVILFLRIHGGLHGGPLRVEFMKRIEVLRSIALLMEDIPSGQRRQVRDLALSLETPRMTTDECYSLLCKVSRLPVNERKGVIDEALRKVTPRMDGYDRGHLLVKILSTKIEIASPRPLRPEDKIDIVSMAISLAPVVPELSDLQKIANMLASFPTEEARSKFFISCNAEEICRELIRK